MLKETNQKVELMGWKGPKKSLATDESGYREVLANLEHSVYAIAMSQGTGLSNLGSPAAKGDALMGYAPPVRAQDLGDPKFAETFGVEYAYFAGSMANGISSAEMVIALGKAGIMASFGAGGLDMGQVALSIAEVQKALPHGPYAFNLIHSPNEKALESGAVDLFLKHKVPVIEASAFLDLTTSVVLYRVKGLKQGEGRVIIQNKIIAKVSRREVAEKFMRPAPEALLGQLIVEGRITEKEAALARLVPMCDALVVEADSGGHTDNRPLVNLLPSMLSLRNDIQEEMTYPNPILIGAGGGIGTPEAVLGTLMMGAAFVVTGSVNQACVESGTSEHVRKLLAEAGMADVIMAPASDMFEQGVRLQVLRRGTLFAMRAQKLYDLYIKHKSIDQIPLAERTKIEKQLFKKSLDDVWADCVTFFGNRDPAELAKAESNPKKKMALVFRWYLGQSSHWAKSATAGREMDYQIWTGPAMGAFNDWVRGSYLEQPENRKAVPVALELLGGAAYLARLRGLELQGVRFGASVSACRPRG